MNTVPWTIVGSSAGSRLFEASGSKAALEIEVSASHALSAPATSLPPAIHAWRRRQVIGGLLAGSVAACTGLPRTKPASQHLPLEGTPIYSESVQVSLADSAGKNFLSIRLCQYPDAGVAWLWAAILVDGEFIQVADNAVPWQGGASVVPGAAQASYTAQSDSASLSFVREGTLSQPILGRMKFVSSSNSATQVEVTFSPSELYEGLIPGRAEVFGRAAAVLSIRGRAVKLEGPGQWHEQQQSDPRFVTPFFYASIWGEGVFATFLQTPGSSGGYVISPAGVAGYAVADFNGPEPVREVAITAADGLISKLRFEERHHYTLDIYDKPWRGSFVHGQIEGVPVSGFLNSWLSIPD